jgi:hypothetical protein
MVRLGMDGDHAAGNGARGSDKIRDEDTRRGRFAPIGEDVCSLLVKRDKDPDRVSSVAIEEKMLALSNEVPKPIGHNIGPFRVIDGGRT